MSVVLKMPPESERRPRRRRLKYIAVLPTLMTLANLVCGFSAIHFGLRAMYAAGAEIDSSVEATLDSQLVERMLPSFLSIGAMLVLLGMMLDMLDGLAARLMKRSSEFGAQVDSLADVVTFGVAPAILVVALMMREWHSELVVTPLSVHAVGRAIWVCSAAYCICAAVRLARFNVEQGRADFSHRSFRGLPSPGAAAVIASLVMLHEHVGDTFGAVMLYSLPVVTLGTAFLMISRVRYERITQVYLVKRRPFEHVIVLVVVFVVFWSYKAQTLAVLCCLYAVSGPVIEVVKRWRAGRGGPAEPADSAKEIVVDKRSHQA
ncbi:MAG: CDP-alcohol phosphatidyltransferase family protein [Phycisphaerae bacterium]